MVITLPKPGADAKITNVKTSSNRGSTFVCTEVATLEIFLLSKGPKYPLSTHLSFFFEYLSSPTFTAPLGGLYYRLAFSQ